MQTLSYDIFRRDALGKPIWLEAAADVESAEVRVAELAALAPGVYVIFHARTSKVIAILRFVQNALPA